jgi:hypothetical protein
MRVSPFWSISEFELDCNVLSQLVTSLALTCGYYEDVYAGISIGIS